jgi:hypothetical protein
MVNMPKAQSKSAVESKLVSDPESDGDKKFVSQEELAVTKNESNSVPKLPFMLKKRLTKKKTALLVIMVLFLVIILPFAYASYRLYSLKAPALEVTGQVRGALDSVKNQDLVTAKTQLDQAYEKVNAINQTYQSVSYLNYTPLRWHYQDGQHLVNSGVAGIEAAQIGVGALEPYADVIGFAGPGSFTGGTVENRIVKILETVGIVSPQLDQVQAKITYIKGELEAVNPKRYPFEVGGRRVEDLITDAQSQLGNAESNLAQVRPLIDVLPQVAGVDEAKKYLIMFQNDGEIRATGGFMTAFAIVNVDKGMVIPEKSDDIYELDDKFTKNLKPPAAYEELLLVRRWNLRDMNVSPDYKTSITTFQEHYNTLPGESEVDGIIAIDTQVLSRLVEVLGPLEVPGYGTFSAEIDPRCDCPEIIYEIEDIATRPTPYFRSDRKAILGPMMGSMLAKAFAAEQDIWPPLFKTVWDLINEKHILFYFNDPTKQEAVELNHMAGLIEPSDTDYLHINDTNLGGAKSYMFIEQEVEQDITVTEGSVEKTLTITYKNPRKGDNCNLEAGQLCLNGRMPLWIRVYVPSGSELVDSQGFDEGSVKTSEDLGKTVYEGVLVIDPESSRKVSLTYKPVYAPPSGTYELFIQKQPGTRDPDYTISVNGFRSELDLKTDEKVVISYQ